LGFCISAKETLSAHKTKDRGRAQKGIGQLRPGLPEALPLTSW
jgi:hypothetical protein